MYGIEGVLPLLLTFAIFPSGDMVSYSDDYGYDGADASITLFLDGDLCENTSTEGEKA